MSARRIRNDIKSKRLATDTLEQESRAMEQRLLELKIAMNREREEREKMGMDGHWRKGQKGSLFYYQPQIKENDLTSKINKVKMLKDEPIVVPKRNKEKVLQATKHELLKTMGQVCGQCENQRAYVHCQECGEEFCAKCFAAFHLKGALRKHRSVPLSDLPVRISSGRKQSAATGNDDSNYNNQSVNASSTENTSREVKRNQWISNEVGSETVDKTKNDNRKIAINGSERINNFPLIKATHATDMADAPFSINTPKPRPKKEIKIVFNSSLTYAEQLLLKRHRREETSPLPPYNNSFADEENVYRNGGGTARETLLEKSENMIYENESASWNELCSTYPRPLSVVPLYSQDNHQMEDEFNEKADENEINVNKSNEPNGVVTMEATEERPTTRTTSRKSARTPRKILTPRTTADRRLEGGHLIKEPGQNLLNLVENFQKIKKDENDFENENENKSWLTLGLVQNGMKSNADNDGEGRIEERSSSRIQSGRRSSQKSARSDKHVKLSYQFYTLSPRSWKPDVSLLTDSVPESMLQCDDVVKSILSAEAALQQENSRDNTTMSKISKTPLDLAEDEGRSDYEEEMESARKLEEDIMIAARTTAMSNYSVDSMDSIDTSTAINSESLLNEVMNMGDTSESDVASTELSLQDSLDVAKLS